MLARRLGGYLLISERPAVGSLPSKDIIQVLSLPSLHLSLERVVMLKSVRNASSPFHHFSYSDLASPHARAPLPSLVDACRPFSPENAAHSGELSRQMSPT